ncbi:ABC transporter ATP-binding protein [soil metagenome]
MLIADHLRVTFGHGSAVQHAVNDVTFAVKAGESFGLVGESGSGKSTILRAICSLVPKTAGEIRVDGTPVTSPPDRSLYRTVQMVFQDPYGSLHPRQTLDQCLAEPLAIHRIADAEPRILAALRDVGLPSSFRFRYPHQLSGGQRQRAAIARALILRPKLLLLDEPTSALDASVQAEILNLLEKLRRELNLTYVLVSHNLAVVAHLCSRLLVLKDGRTVEETTSEALRSAAVGNPYTQALLVASEGFTPAPAKVERVVA